jgi:hypothetical protein
MPIWLLTFLPIAWRWFKHLVIYLIILLIIVGPPFISYQYGWRKGYSQCSKDNPTYGTVGQVVNYHNGKKTLIGIWFLSLDLNTEWFGSKKETIKSNNQTSITETIKTEVKKKHWYYLWLF